MWAFIVLVWVSARQKIPLSVLGRNPHKELAREIFHETGRGRGKEGPWENREGSRKEKRAEKRPGQRKRQSAGESRWLLGCVDLDDGFANVRRWVGIPGDFVGISHEDTLVIACRCRESCTKVSQTSPFLRLELTQVHVCLFVCSLFFLPLGCVCCVLWVRKEIWNTLGRRWEKPLDDLMAMSGLGSWDSGSRPAVCCDKQFYSTSNIR